MAVTSILTAMTGLVGLISLILFVMVLIKLFQNEGTGKGILGIICGLYTFIWGWMKAKELEMTDIMLFWSFVIVLQIVLSIVVNVTAVSQIPEMLQMMDMLETQ